MNWTFFFAIPNIWVKFLRAWVFFFFFFNKTFCFLNRVKTNLIRCIWKSVNLYACCCKPFVFCCYIMPIDRVSGGLNIFYFTEFTILTISESSPLVMYFLTMTGVHPKFLTKNFKSYSQASAFAKLKFWQCWTNAYAFNSNNDCGVACSFPFSIAKI